MQLRNNSTLQNGKYRIDEFLGQGGFGITYLGVQTGLNRKVAIKEFFMKEYCNRDSSTSRVSVGSAGSRELVDRFRRKFLKEAQTIAELDHPQIIRIYDVFEENNTAYYVMEYLSGGNLLGRIPAGGMTEADALCYIRQLCRGLSYIHSRNILHLDIKPSNICFRKNGDLVIIDFGVSKHYDEKTGSQTSSTPVGRSAGYAPLEQYVRSGISSFSASTDIYSLGATLYHLLSGVCPPDASFVQDEGLPELPARVSERTRTAVIRAMSPCRKDRPQSVAAFLQLLGDSVEEKSRNAEVKDEETVSDAVVVEPEVLKPGKVSDSGKASVSGRMSLRKWLAPVIICLLAGLGVYLFKGGKTDNSGTLNDTLAIFSDTLSIDSIVNDNDTLALVEASSQTDVSSSVSSESSGTGRINGHDYVDLGLRVKWATCNVGAYCPEDYGDYFAWGEIQTKSEYTIKNSLTFILGKNIGNIFGNSQYDVARAQWGGSWRLPTKSEIQELKEQCKWKWITVGGHKGYRVIGSNGNSIFLPAAGYRDGTSVCGQGSNGLYWSGTHEDSGFRAYYLGFYDSNVYWGYHYCHFGYSVRPVSE